MCAHSDLSVSLLPLHSKHLEHSDSWVLRGRGVVLAAPFPSSLYSLPLHGLLYEFIIDMNYISAWGVLEYTCKRFSPHLCVQSYCIIRSQFFMVKGFSTWVGYQRQSNSTQEMTKTQEAWISPDDRMFGGRVKT